MVATYMALEWWMKKEVVCIYTMKNYSTMKKNEIGSFSDVEEPRLCHTEWNKSGGGKQISYINTHMWHLEKWYWWIYLQDRTKDTDVMNEHVDTMKEREGGTNWDSSVNMYPLVCVK